MALSEHRLAGASIGRAAPASPAVSAAGTLGLDWLIVVLNLIFVGGVAADVWSHRFAGPDNFVLSEYHVSFVAAIMLLGALLALVGWRNLRAGAAWHAALPAGYALTGPMVALFFAGTVADQAGHWAFGFERGFETLMSPTHLLLFVSGGLALGGAVGANARRLADAPQASAGALAPLLINVALVVAWATLATVAWMPLTGVFPMVEAARTADPNSGQGYGVARMILQTAVVMSGLLWLASAARLPFGSLTGVLALYGAFCGVLMGSAALLPLWLLVGLLTDLAYRWLRPAAGRRVRMIAFGVVVPLILWGLFYGFLSLTGTGGGIWWSGYIWTGSLVYQGLVGGLCAFLISVGGPARAEVRV